LSKSLSNTQLKKRLLGAGLLVLLAVILIPLFLGEPKYVEAPDSEEPQSTSFESRIQPLPGNPVTADSEIGSNTDEAEQSGGLVLKKLDSEDAVGKQSEPVVIQPLRLDTVTSGTTKSAKTAVAKPRVDKPRAAKQATTPPARVVKKTAAPKKSTKTARETISSGWAVQAGIFSKSANAKAIAENLKKSGFKPNISDAKASFGKARRVWIGPFASKSEAQAVSRKLEKKIGDGGYVAAYPFKS